MDGIGSFIFLTDQDLGKNSDVQLTLTSRALQVAASELLARGLRMPAHFRCVSDNASGETKNNYVFQWMCWLVARRKLISGMLCQGRVGHTHGREDRKFAIASKGLRQSRVLQDPEDFAQRLHKTLAPSTEGNLVIEKLDVCFKWREFFARLPPQFRFKGLTQTHTASENCEEACHVFKFVRRETLDEKIEIDNPFTGVEESPRDVVLLVKQYMASTEMVQRPMVCFPAIGLEYLGQFPKTNYVLPREPLSERQVREFQRTADLVEKEPWALHRAAKYLRTLIDNNAQGKADTWVEPDIGWVFQDVSEDSRGCALCIDDDDKCDVFDVSFAVTKPIPVRMAGGNVAGPTVAVPSARRSTPPQKKHRIDADLSVKGAPLGSHALEQGQPEGSSVAKVPVRIHQECAAGEDGEVSIEGNGGAAQSKARPKAKPTAKPRAKPKCSFKVVIPAGVQVGCSKCRRSPTGCGDCRAKAGLVQVRRGHWELRAPSDPA